MNMYVDAARPGLMARIGGGALIGVATLIGLAGITLAGLYMADNLYETDGIKRVRCWIAPKSGGCPARLNEIASLREELAQLGAQRDSIKADRDAIGEAKRSAQRQLDDLRALENTVDKITLFEMHGGLFSKKIIVGTVYTRFVGSDARPDYHYCYIQLPEGAAGEERIFNIRGQSGDIDVRPAMLEAADLSSSDLDRARSVCKPRLIGPGA